MVIILSNYDLQITVFFLSLSSVSSPGWNTYLPCIPWIQTVCLLLWGRILPRHSRHLPGILFSAFEPWRASSLPQWASGFCQCSLEPPGTCAFCVWPSRRSPGVFYSPFPLLSISVPFHPTPRPASLGSWFSSSDLCLRTSSCLLKIRTREQRYQTDTRITQERQKASFPKNSFVISSFYVEHPDLFSRVPRFEQTKSVKPPPPEEK